MKLAVGGNIHRQFSRISVVKAVDGLRTGTPGRRFAAVDPVDGSRDARQQLANSELDLHAPLDEQLQIKLLLR